MSPPLDGRRILYVLAIIAALNIAFLAGSDWIAGCPISAKSGASR